MRTFNDLSNNTTSNHIDYWQAHLIDLPILALPTDRLHPATQSYTVNSQSFTLSPDLTQELHKINEQHQTTLFMTLLAIFLVLLHRYSHQEDIVVGTPIKQNFLVLRTDVSGNRHFTELLAQVKDVTLKAYQHQDVPFETLINVLNIPSDSSRHPIFQVLFALHEFNDEVCLNSVFDLSLECCETPDGLVGRVSYATDLFNASTIQRLIEHFKTLTTGVIENTTAYLAELLLITEAERHQLVVEWNQTTAELPQARFVHQLFEEQVTKTPNQSSWYSLVPVQLQGSRPPLFAIHTITMRDLPRYLGKEQPLYFLRYGMATETHNPPLKLPYLKELASHYIKEIQQLQPQGPYYIMGFSFGGLIAYEMACQLKANGHQVNFLGLLDAYLRREKLSLPLSQKISKLLSNKPYRIMIWIKNKICDKLTHQQQSTDFFPYTYTRAPDVECRKGYQPEVYSEQVTLFQGDEWDSIFHSYERPEQAWRELLGEKLKVEQVTGNHFEICREPHVRLLAERINACISQSINTIA